MIKNKLNNNLKIKPNIMKKSVIVWDQVWVDNKIVNKEKVILNLK